VKENRVSISEVLFVINGGPPANIDPEASKRGIAAHRKLTEEMVGGVIPPTLRKAGLTAPVRPGKLVETDVGDSLSLSARPDLIGEGITVELKPGGEIRGRHLLQTAATCVARKEKGKGVVYLYQIKTSYLMPDGGEVARPEIEKMAHASRRILDIQTTLKNQGRSLGFKEKFDLNKESAKLGKELQQVTEIACRKLQKQLVKIA
jgi:hypothetical protein